MVPVSCAISVTCAVVVMSAVNVMSALPVVNALLRVNIVTIAMSVKDVATTSVRMSLYIVQIATFVTTMIIYVKLACIVKSAGTKNVEIVEMSVE